MAAKKNTEKKESIVTENPAPVVETTTPIAAELKQDEIAPNSEGDAWEPTPVDPPKTIEEAISSVDIELASEESDDAITKKIEDDLAPVNELANDIKDLEEGQKDLNEKLSKNPENAETLIKEEIEKAQELKTKVENLINETKTPVRKHNVTNWWNGMGYDF